MMVVIEIRFLTFGIPLFGLYSWFVLALLRDELSVYLYSSAVQFRSWNLWSIPELELII